MQIAEAANQTEGKTDAITNVTNGVTAAPFYLVKTREAKKTEIDGIQLSWWFFERRSRGFEFAQSHPQK